VISLPAIIEVRARRSPDAIVLRGATDSLTAAQLVERVRALAGALKESGAAVVALYADNGIPWVVVDLACQLEGICLVPVPTFFSADQVNHVIGSAGVELVIAEPWRRELLQLSGECIELTALPGLSACRITGTRPASMPPNCQKITFTSGSTGEPKGVCLSTEQCLAVAHALAEAIQVEQARHLCVLPLSTLLENIGGVYVPLLTGGCVVVAPPRDLGLSGSSKLEAARFLQALTDNQPQTMILVPQLLSVLDVALSQGWSPPGSLAFVAVGGARVAPEMLRRVRTAGLPVYEGYGLSECASVVSLNRPGCDKPGTSGRVLSHVWVGERDGQLQVSGNAFLGYLNKPESWGQTQIRTGDLGNVDEEGFVTVVGRCNNVLISSFGRNINPEWVESEVMASGVFRQVLAVGEGRPHCAALLFPVDPGLGDDAIEREMASVCRRLPDYARPRVWLRMKEPFTVDNGLLTENGRPRRVAINAAYAREIERLYSQPQELSAV